MIVSAGAAISIVSVAWSAIGAFWPNPARQAHMHGSGRLPQAVGAGTRRTVPPHRAISPSPYIGARIPKATSVKGRTDAATTTATTCTASARWKARRVGAGASGAGQEEQPGDADADRCDCARSPRRVGPQQRAGADHEQRQRQADVHHGRARRERRPPLRSSATSPPVPPRSRLTSPAPGSAACSPSAIGVSLPPAERLAEARGEHVVGEPGDGPLAAGLPHAARVARDRRAAPPAPRPPRCGVAVACGPRGPSRRGPRLRRRPRCRRPPGGHRPRPPRGTRCRSPPARGPPTGCGRAWRRRRRSRRARGGRRGTPDPGAGRSARRDDEALQASGVPATPSDGDDEVRPEGARSALARIRVSMPLRGTRRLRLTTRRPSTGSPSRERTAARSVGVEGVEPLRVDTGGHDDARQRAARRPLALGERVAAGGDHEGRTPQHVAEHEVRPWEPPGHGDLGAVEHDGVGPSQARTEQTDRQRRVEHDAVGADLVGQRLDPAGERPGGQQHRLARCAPTRKGCAASHAALSGWRVVSTANDDGSSRRHSSQSIVWIPPILGGKSLVTKRWVMGRRSASSSSTNGIVLVPERGEQILASEAAGGPDGVATQERVGVPQVAIEHRRDRGIVAVADVAQHDQGVAPHVAHLALGDVPAARVARARRRHRGRAGRAGAPMGVLRAGGGADGRTAVGRADLLAVVTAVDAIAERDPVARRGTAPRPAAARTGSAERRPRPVP